MSDTKKYLKTEHGERIDQPDFQHQAERSQHNGLTQLTDGIIVGRDRTRALGEANQPRHYVLKGFSAEYNAGLITVQGGTAIMGYEYNHAVQYGAFTSKESSRIVDTSVVTDATLTYGVWVRFVLAEGDDENRAFWNSAGGTPAEEVRTVPTRLIEDWQVQLSVNAPSTAPEAWMKIWDYDVTAPGSEMTDKRVFFFEGTTGSSPDWRPVDGEWGDNTYDRSTDRPENGIFGMRRFVRAMQRQIQDIIGPSGAPTPFNWYDHTGLIRNDDQNGNAVIPEVGANLYWLKSESLSAWGGRDGLPAVINQILSDRMRGHLWSDTADNYDIGEQAVPWKDIFARAVELGGARLASAADALIPRIVGNMFDGTERMLLLESTPGSDTEKTIRMYLGPDSMGIEITHNAEWDSSTSLWGRDVTTTAASSAVRFSPSGGLKYLTRSIAEPANTWSDTSSATNWETTFIVGSNGVTQTFGTTTVNSSLHIDDEVVVVDGGVTLAGAGKYVLAPYLKGSNALLAAAAAVHNQPIIGGGASIKVGADPALNNSNIPKAWGRINISLGTCSIYAGCGIKTANTTGGSAGYLYIELADSFATSGVYTVVGITINGVAGERTMWSPISASEFEIGLYNGGFIDLTTYTVTISFQVMGNL